MCKSGFKVLRPFAVCLLLVCGNVAAFAEARIALVIGNSKYAGTPLPTALNDAGLIAQTLKDTGFDVIEGGELDQASLRKSIRDYMAKVEAAGADTTAFVYFNGLGLQLDGDNYILPIDARLQRVGDLAVEGFRLNDLLRPLAGLPAKSRIVILDAASPSPFDKIATDIARGLGVVDKQPGVFVGFAQAPGQVYVGDAKAAYGPFASGLAEMMREPGLKFDEAYDRARLRVHERTKGQMTPWDSNGLEAAPILVAAVAESINETASLQAQRSAIQSKPINELSPEEAYALAVERDTIPAYQKFVDAFPQSPLAKRVRALLAERREAYFWRRTVSRDSREAYWTYVKSYPRGPHNGDARRRLARMSAPYEPPVSFAEVVYEDVPPPPREEVVIVEEFYARPVYEPLYYDYPPPPPAPIFLLPPPPPYFIYPPPPPAFFGGPGFLPIPVPIPVFIPYSRRPTAPPFVPPPPVPVVPTPGVPTPGVPIGVRPTFPVTSTPSVPVVPLPGVKPPAGTLPVVAPAAGQIGSPLPKPPLGAIQARPGAGVAPANPNTPATAAPLGGVPQVGKGQIPANAAGNTGAGLPGAGQTGNAAGGVKPVLPPGQIAPPAASAAAKAQAVARPSGTTSGRPVLQAPRAQPAITQRQQPVRQQQVRQQQFRQQQVQSRVQARPQPQFRQQAVARPQYTPRQAAPAYRPPAPAYRPPPQQFARPAAPVFRPAPAPAPRPAPQRKVCPPGRPVC